MKLKERYLVVAAIISGKNFPIRNGYNIIAEAKFDGEVLSTDPVNHLESPLFEQELAWELDKKSLHQHKLQRSCLKIQFFAVSNLSPVKEFVGYIMLDLRSASSNKVHKFYPLLHGKYFKNRPEICCAIYLDDDGQEVVHESTNLGGAMSIDPAQLKPKLVSNSSREPCYYQIGPEKLCKDGFLMSLIIYEASNLTYLIPTEISISNNDNNGFYFYYDLFGNNILSEKFSDLVSAKFLTERTSVNILSTLDILKMYFNSQENIEIHLCCNQHSLGIAKIPVNTLLNNVDHSFQQPAVLENCFNFVSSKPNARQNKDLVWNKDEPSISISVSLQRVQRFGDVSVNVRKKSSSIEHLSPSNNNIVKTQSNSNLNIDHRLEMHNKEQTVCFSETPFREHLRHLCYSIELRSIRNLTRADHTKRIYTRYVYPLFGSAAPIMTHPPVEVRRDQNVLLPQGYCAFEFGGSWKSLERKLFNNPLIVKVFERDKTKDADHCLGFVTVPLSKVLSDYSKKSNNKGYVCLTFGDVGQIIDSSNGVSNGNSIGQLVYNLTLEDFGPLKEQLSTQKTEKIKSSSSTSNLNHIDENGRNNAEYKAALELELWKENEEIAFMAQLKEKERQTMMSLAEEWKRRDKEREILIKKKVSEYDELEKALRTAIINLAQRERQLAAGEIELQRLRKDLESEVDRRSADLREASRRLEQDCQHQNLMVSSQAEHWKSMAQDWQHKYQQIDKEFTQYKSRQSNTPETKLQSELNVLQSDKLKMEEALENALKSKAHYKKQWMRALNEVARLKQKEDQMSKDALHRQEMELEQMKMRYKSIEDSTAGGSSQLDALRQELNKLREEAQIESNRQNEEDKLNIDINGMDEVTTEHVMRLIEERDVLLRTGLYTSHDQVITELDRQIRKLMENSAGH